MRTQLKLTIVAFVAFTSGLLTHTKLHAQVNKEVISKSESRRYVRHGKASWYSKKSPGINKHTANNELFDDRAYTAAMWGVPFNQRIKVTNIHSGESIIVRVNDRGPHLRFVQRGRIIDLTEKAFQQIGGLRDGLIEVELEFL